MCKKHLQSLKRRNKLRRKIEDEDFKRKLAEAWHAFQNIKIPIELYREFKLNMMLANLQLEAKQEGDEIEYD